MTVIAPAATAMPEAGQIRGSRTTPSPTLRELAAILFRQSRSVVAAFTLVFLVTLLYPLVSPQYEARLKVLLRRGRSDPVVSAQPSNLADFTRPAISEEELNSEVELLHDESLLKQVVVQCGLASPGDVVAGRSENVERAVRKLARTLTVEPLRKSNLIQVRYQARDAQETANVLSTLATFYLRKHIALQRPSGEAQFFEKQTAEYETRLHESEAELVRFTRDRGVAAPALERDVAIQKLGEAEAAYRQIDQEQVENERRVIVLQGQLKSFPSRSVTLKRWADNLHLLEKLKTHLLELQLIAGCCFSVFPSHAYETLGKSILESYAWGRPVVASDLGSRREMVEQGVTGFLYPAGDLEQLAEAIEFLFNRAGLSARMGMESRRRLHTMHDPDRHLDTLLEIYSRLATRKSLAAAPARTKSKPSPQPHSDRLRVAFIGGRGLVSKYSGIESYYEQVGAELTRMGHEVTVYCRSYFTPPIAEYKGIRVRRLPTIRSKHLETLAHTFLGTVHAMFSRYDVVHYHCLGPALFSFMPRLAGKKTVVTVQGLDWQRRKWAGSLREYCAGVSRRP